MNTDTGRTDRIHAQLLRAKARQQRLYILIAFILVAGALFTLALIAFSNATTIKVHPAEARDTAVVTAVGGFAAAIGNSVYALHGNPIIEVSANGFRPLKKTLQTSESGGTVDVELAELPGQLHITTTPAADNTRWFVDGDMVMVAKELKQALFSGQYHIEIDSPYFQKTTSTVHIERDKKLHRNIDLQPVSGHLAIQTVPAGANIRINGKEAGTSPLSLAKTGGKYHLEVTHDDHQTITEDVEITNTENVIEREYRLAFKDAYLDIRVSPTGGVLLLNGKKVSLTEKLAIKARINNTLTYFKTGYFPQTRTLAIAPDVEKTLTFHLKPEIGVVNIRAMPQASVVVDGKIMGQTPLVLKLSARPHQIELRRKGYRKQKKTLTPSSKSTQRINAVLRTELQARLAEMPAELINSAGIQLKRFNPQDTFIMGAPRHEKGQRANEFLRSVKLSKPFYVGKYEVSVDQYSRFKTSAGAGNHPVRSVSWIDAAAYCNWLSGREKLAPFYAIRSHRLRGVNVHADGYRLLSEAEWEWLARKAAKPEQSKFTWGNETTIPEKSGNIADESAKGKTSHYIPNYSDGHAGVAPIGSYPAEKSGVYDLTGNVSEWVHDVYSLIPPDGQKTELNPFGTRTGATHTVKGSNWRSGTITELRPSYREGAKEGRDDIGFRIARFVYGGSQ
ncbi:MAG: SUMF1/EgtB/PvdO family nonheme iron enzyme [Mariprofundaceae bacterium]